MNDNGIIEQLHSDLRRYVARRPPFGLELNHPLVNFKFLDKELPLSVELPFKSMAEVANHSYEQKRRQVAKAIEADDWMTFVLLHERSWRLPALLDAIEQHDWNLRRLWPVVGHVWIDTESVRYHNEHWREIWSTTCSRRKFAMEAKDRAKLRRMPDELIVWRGVSHKGAVRGLSWTLDRDMAVWFANRTSSGRAPRFLVEGRIRKADVCAYFTGRNESEVVVLPEHVEIVSTKRLKAEAVEAA